MRALGVAPTLYRKKPGHITAVRIIHGTLRPEELAKKIGRVAVLGSVRVFVRTAGGEHRMDDPDPRFEVWNELHQSWIGFEVGDFLRIDDEKDVYPIDYDTFCKTYEPVHPDATEDQSP